MKVKLAKKWVNPADATEHAAGAVLDLDDAIGKTLVGAEVADKVAEPGDVTGAVDEAIAGLEAKLEHSVARAVRRASEGFELKGRRIAVGSDLEIDEDPRQGFTSFGEFARDVKSACAVGQPPSDRLQKIAAAAKASGVSEGVGAEGGFLVPTDFNNRLLERAQAVLGIMALCDWTKGVSGNSIEVTAYIDHDRSGTTYRYGGVIPYWLAEAAQIAASRLKVRKIRLTLNKLGCLVYVTDEELEDASVNLGEKLEARMGAAIGGEAVEALFAGDGVGKPKGILSAACRVTVPKETGQAAATIVVQNLAKMLARNCEDESSEGEKATGRSRFYYNRACLPQLLLLNASVGTGGVLVWLPSGGVAGAPYETLWGIPTFKTGHCSALGEEGDIVLADWSKYLLATKGTMKSAMSIHLRFDYDEAAFKATWRLAGEPAWDSPLTPRKGSDTLSPFVTLAARG